MPWISGGIALGGAYMKQKGEKGAAKEGKKTANAFKKMQKQQDVKDQATFNEQSSYMTPWMDAGREALGTLTQKINNGEYDPGQFHFDYASFEKDPGYAFRVREGQRAMEQGAAARGKLLSGQQQKALQGYGQEMGSQEYGNAFNRATTEWDMNARRLQNNYGMLNALNQQGMQAANVIGNWRGDLGNAQRGGLQNYMGARSLQGQANQAQYNSMAETGSNMMGMGLGNLFGAPSSPPQQQPIQQQAYQPSGNEVMYNNAMGGVTYDGTRYRYQ